MAKEGKGKNKKAVATKVKIKDLRLRKEHADKVKGGTTNLGEEPLT